MANRDRPFSNRATKDHVGKWPSCPLCETHPHVEVVNVFIRQFDQLLASDGGEAELNLCKANLGRKISDLLRILDDSLPDDANAGDPKFSDTIETVAHILKNAWSVPFYGVVLGEECCAHVEEIKLQRIVSRLILEPELDEQQDNQNYAVALLLEQLMIGKRRNSLISNYLTQLLAVAKQQCRKTGESLQVRKRANGTNNKNAHPLLMGRRVGVSLISKLYGHSEGTCTVLNGEDAFGSIVYNICHEDAEIQIHSAAAFANLALFGPPHDKSVIRAKVGFVFFGGNSGTALGRFWGNIAIAALSLDRVCMVALKNQKLIEGNLKDFCMEKNFERLTGPGSTYVIGQSEEFLEKFKGTFDSLSEGVRCFVSFFYRVEGRIKDSLNQKECFEKIQVIEKLTQAASSGQEPAASFAQRTLGELDFPVPSRMNMSVFEWDSDEVAEWVQRAGFPAFVDKFKELDVDGDLLLQLNDEILENDIGMRSAIVRKRFFRQLTKLKQECDYTTIDSENLVEILYRCGPEFVQYAYDFIRSGANKELLPKLKMPQLKEAFGVQNQCHRVRLSAHFADLTRPGQPTMDANVHYDAFISYRRDTGRHLANLVYVNLKQAGLKIFLDIRELRTGKFDNKLVHAIKNSTSFVFLMTKDALERCKGDVDKKDWVHLEILQALRCKLKIIVVKDGQRFPPQDQLPEDIRDIVRYNAVEWSHHYFEDSLEQIKNYITSDKAPQPADDLLIELKTPDKINDDTSKTEPKREA